MKSGDVVIRDDGQVGIFSHRNNLDPKKVFVIFDTEKRPVSILRSRIRMHVMTNNEGISEETVQKVAKAIEESFDLARLTYGETSQYTIDAQAAITCLLASGEVITKADHEAEMQKVRELVEMLAYDVRLFAPDNEHDNLASLNETNKFLEKNNG